MTSILLFHRLAVGDRGHGTVEPSLFEACLDALAGRRVAPVRDRLGAKGEGVAITFDDGYESDRSLAFPALIERGMRATFFIVTGRVGERGRMSAAQLRELDAAGMELGSHTHTHPFLPELSDADLDRELTASKDALEQLLGRPVTSLSIPGGETDGRVLAAARRAGYAAVCGSRPGLNPSPLGGILRRNAFHRFHRVEDIPAVLNPPLRVRAAYEARALVKRALGPRGYLCLRDAVLGSREEP